MDAIVGFFKDVEDTLLIVASSAAVIGFLGLGMMYALSSLPIVSTWKQDNPRAFTSVVTGLGILAFAGSGGRDVSCCSIGASSLS